MGEVNEIRTGKDRLRPDAEVHLQIQGDELGEHALLAIQESGDGVGPAQTRSVVIARLESSDGGCAFGSTLPGKKFNSNQKVVEVGKELTVVFMTLSGTARIWVVV